jgi:hypothetical protein
MKIRPFTPLLFITSLLKENYSFRIATLILLWAANMHANALAATKTWVGAAGGGSWSTAANWSPASSPGASDDIVINAGTNAMSFTGLSSLTIATLTINGTTGSVTWTSGSATITVTGAIISQVNVTSGVASLVTQGTGGSIAAGKTFTISSGTSFNISTSTGNGFNVPSTATLTVLGSSLQSSTSNNSGLTVSGTLNWNNGTSCTIYPMTLNASGFFNLMGAGQKSFSTGVATLIYGKLSMQGNTYGGTAGTLPQYFSGSTLEYAQSSAQNVGNEWPTGTANLPPLILVNTASGISLSTGSTRTVPLGGTLNIQNGKLTISTGDLTIETTAVITQTTPSSNYIVTGASSGKVIRKFTNAATQNFTYPVGNATKYRPVVIAITGNSSTRSIGFSTSLPGGEPNAWYACGGSCNNNDYTNCSWYCEHTGSGGMNYQLTFYYQPSDFVGTTPANLKVSRTPNGTWTAYPTTYNALPYIQMSSAVSELANPLTGTDWMGRNCVPPPSINITPSGPTTFCLGGSVGLTAAGAGSYNWSPSSGLSSTTIANPTASPTVTTTYTVTGTDAGSGCTNTANITITVNQPPAISINVSPSSTVCPGNSVTLTASGGGSYAWSGGISNGVSFVPPATTTYSVTVTSGAGCTNTASQLITVGGSPPVVGINVTPGISVCPGTSVTLSGTGAVSYLWSGGISDGVPFVPIVSGSYTVTGTDISGCTNTATQSITVNPLPSVGVNVTPSATVCTGTSITLSGTGASTYLWSGGVTNAAPFVALASGTYTVTGTDGNGCTNTANQSITVNPLPSVGINVTPSGTVCEGTSITLSGTGASTYSWSGGVSNASPFVPLASGTYTVTGTDGNGCTNTSSQLITLNPMPATGVSQNASTLTADQSGATYQWLDCNSGMIAILGETGQSFTATVNGNYAVAITLAGCTDTSACNSVIADEIGNSLSTDGLKFFPNPVSDILKIRSSHALIGADYFMTNSQGIIVIKGTFGAISQVDMRQFPPGLYLLWVGEQEGIVRRVMKE